MSWRWVHALVTHYEQGGLDAVEPRSTTGEILGQYDIKPDRNYWPKKQGTPTKGQGSPI